VAHRDVAVGADGADAGGIAVDGGGDQGAAVVDVRAVVTDRGEAGGAVVADGIGVAGVVDAGGVTAGADRDGVAVVGLGEDVARVGRVGIAVVGAHEGAVGQRITLGQDLAGIVDRGIALERE